MAETSKPNEPPPSGIAVALLLAFLWLVVCTLFQDYRKLGWVFALGLAVFVLSLWVYIYRDPVARSLILGMFALLFCVIAAFVWANKTVIALSLIALAVHLVAAGRFDERYLFSKNKGDFAAIPKGVQRWINLLPLLIFIGLWVSASIAHRLEGGIPVALGKALPRSKAEYANKRVGLALSGGGYRAALMHAGVLEAFEHFGLVPANIGTVSGGSIIGSYYVSGGRPREFLEIAPAAACPWSER